LRDWSGYGQNGTLTNMDAVTDWVTSGGRYALDFDGVNDFVGFGTTYPQSATQPFSLVMSCVGRLSFTRWKRLTSGGWILVDIDISGTRRIGFGYISSAGDGRWSYTNTVYDPARLNTVVGTADGSNTLGGFKTFLNGVEITAKTIVGNTNVTIDAAAQVRIAGTDGTAEYIPFTVLSCAIYNRVLSPAEAALCALRPGIAYELAPRRRSSSAVQFNRRRRLLLGST
jgi:hypothetical protein